ncbi:reverse transcriptase [Gregarina niphandrodes]|uniref:Reverse transcriptase n=1 Tax=Gregarina niphandrodes TaxID=110365 RepID=A0A023AWX5_GRENI|nr:reverse transcriptase [Gregarina niphandrodes]EZG43082.1 reverse transcriptase [Gregarina niphandrodes]|eukprot:XP_011133645.1 reverse transcriptase [Gregarina niphandrodes]
MGNQGLTLVDTNGDDLEPEQARRQLRQMLHDRWSKADTARIPPKRESRVYLDQPPHTEEIVAAIKAINKKAATGLDGIPAKHVHHIPTDDLEQFIHLVWTDTRLPRQLVDMKVKPIPKLLPRTTVENTRPITIPSTIMKIINQVILQHITPYIELHLLPQQHAYRRGKGTGTAVTELFAKFNRPGQTLLLLDLSKAFDTVDHTALFAALRATNIPSKEYNLIRDQYIDAEVRIQWAKRYTTPFPLTNGIRQGCTLSATLFNLVEAEREKKCRRKMHTIPYEVIMYADDKAVILEDDTHIQRMLDTNAQTASEYGMLQNNSKTARLKLDKDTKEIHTVKWMGILLDNKLSMNQEVEARIEKAKKAAKDYTEAIRNIPSSMINAAVKVRGACTIILPHLVYLWREIPFTPTQRNTLTDTATQLLAKVFSNTSGVTATAIQRHVHEITKGLTPRFKEMATLDHLMPKQLTEDVAINTEAQQDGVKGTDILYAHSDLRIDTLPDKGPTELKTRIPRLQLPNRDTETNFFSPREEPHYEETRDVFTTALETSPPTPGFGQDKHYPNSETMALRLNTIQGVETVQLTCPYCGITKTTKQATRAHYTTTHPGMYRPPPDDPCYCAACRRVMTKTYFRDHRCRKPHKNEFDSIECPGCQNHYENPELSAHMIHCVRLEGVLTPSKPNTGAFEFAKKLRDLLKPTTAKKATSPTQITIPGQTIEQARQSLRPHTPRKPEQSNGDFKRIPPIPKAKDHPEITTKELVQEMRTNTEEAIRTEQSTCRQCNKELKSNQALRRHEALYHPGTTRPKGLPAHCIGCNATFKTATTYVKHKCPGPLNQELAAKKCPLCDSEPITNPDYSVHLLRHQVLKNDGTTTPRDLYDPQ